MKRLKLAVSLLVLALGVSAFVSSAGAASPPPAGPTSQPAPSMCADHVVNVVIDSTGALLGTPGDDFVVSVEDVPFYGGGGTDTICDAAGRTIAVVRNDDEGPIEPAPTPTFRFPISEH